jgi:hypothetical protein
MVALNINRMKRDKTGGAGIAMLRFAPAGAGGAKAKHHAGDHGVFCD